MGFRSGLLKKLDTKKGGFQDVTSVLRLTLEKCRKRRRDTPYTERIEVFFILILIFSCATEYNTRLLGMFTSMLYRFIVAGLREQFHGQIWKMATFTLLSSLYQSSKTYCVGCLNRLLRACLTDTLHDRYFEKSSFYRVNRMLDNPDQRIASDVSEFCTTFISFMDKFLLSPILIAQYTYDTYNVDGFKGVVLVYLFFSVGVIIQRLFTPAMTRLYARLDNLEGSFRLISIS